MNFKYRIFFSTTVNEMKTELKKEGGKRKSDFTKKVTSK